MLLVGAVSGTAPSELRQVFRNTLDQVEEQLESEINQFKQDDLSVFEPARPLLEKCLLGQSAPAKAKKARLWPWVTALALAAAGLAGFWIYTQIRWNRYFETLRHQPGIVVTAVDRHWFSYSVAGLKDPQAPDPLELLRAQKLNLGRLTQSWAPYLSLNTPFAARRELEEDTSKVNKQIIRFETNSSKLAIAQLDRIEEIAAALQRILRSHPATQVTRGGPCRRNRLSGH